MNLLTVKTSASRPYNNAGTWDRNGRDLAFLNNRDKRLAEAVALKAYTEYQKRLTNLEFGYLAACEKAESSAKVTPRSGTYSIYNGAATGIMTTTKWQ
jgi:hypothetical protein